MVVIDIGAITMNKKLKPCIRCESYKVIPFKRFVPTEVGELVFAGIRCLNCSYYIQDSRIEEAIERWNRRGDNDNL